MGRIIIDEIVERNGLKNPEALRLANLVPTYNDVVIQDEEKFKFTSIDVEPTSVTSIVMEQYNGLSLEDGKSYVSIEGKEYDIPVEIVKFVKALGVAQLNKCIELSNVIASFEKDLLNEIPAGIPRPIECTNPDKMYTVLYKELNSYLSQIKKSCGLKPKEVVKVKAGKFKALSSLSDNV